MKKGRSSTEDSRDGSRSDDQKEKGTEKRALTFSNKQMFEKEGQKKKIFHFISKCVRLAQRLQHIMIEELNKSLSHHLGIFCVFVNTTT